MKRDGSIIEDIALMSNQILITYKFSKTVSFKSAKHCISGASIVVSMVQTGNEQCF